MFRIGDGPGGGSEMVFGGGHGENGELWLGKQGLWLEPLGLVDMIRV